MKKPEEVELALAEPFLEEEIEWRVQRAGYTKSNNIYAMVLAYVDNRAIFKRLDKVCGIDGWKNDFLELKSGGLLCGISIKINGEWITKWDGADKTQIEPVKGMISGASKRAGVPWGIGRYLYKLPSTFAEVTDNKNDNRGSFTKGTEKVYFNWKTPKLPDNFLP